MIYFLWSIAVSFYVAGFFATLDAMPDNKGYALWVKETKHTEKEVRFVLIVYSAFWPWVLLVDFVHKSMRD